MNKLLMINCPDCEAYISRQAHSCPQCGRLLMPVDFLTLQMIIQDHYKKNQMESAFLTWKLVQTVLMNYEQMSIPEVRAKLRNLDMQIEFLKIIEKEKWNKFKKEWTQPLTFRNFPYLGIIIGIIVGILLAVYF